MPNWSPGAKEAPKFQLGPAERRSKFYPEIRAHGVSATKSDTALAFLSGVTDLFVAAVAKQRFAVSPANNVFSDLKVI